MSTTGPRIDLHRSSSASGVRECRLSGPRLAAGTVGIASHEERTGEPAEPMADVAQTAVVASADEVRKPASPGRWVGSVDDLSGSCVGKYRIERLVGRGAMGVVFAGWDTMLERPVAIKVPSLPAARTAEAAERLYREAKASAALSHTGICRVYEIITVQSRPAIVMEYVDGRPLDELLRQEGPLDAVVAARIGATIADALDLAHDAGVVHRDVKPGNILLRSDGTPVLTDFGLAWRTEADDEPRLTQPGIAVGSPLYMSPEQVSGGHLTAATDIYSLGATICELVTGVPPYRGSVTEVVAQIASGTPVLGRGPQRRIPRSMAAILRRATACDPARRFISAAQLSQALATYARGERPLTGSRLSDAIGLTDPGSRSRVPAIAAGAAGVVAIGLLSFVNGEVPAPQAVSDLGRSPTGMTPPSAAPQLISADDSPRPPAAPPTGGPDVSDPADVGLMQPAGRLGATRLAQELERRPADQVFDDLDFNSNGTLDPSEFPRHIIRRADTDGNDRLTMREFTDGVRKDVGAFVAPPRHDDRTPRWAGESRRGDWIDQLLGPPESVPR